jgi:hypothetical protein
MFDLSPIAVKSRFQALRFRVIPRHVSPGQQARAQALAKTVRAIRPGVYQVGACIVDQWRNACTCGQARRAKVQGRIAACPHRLALWLAEGVDIDNPDPALYLKAADVQEPAIIAYYARIKGLKGLRRIECWPGGWVAVPLNDPAGWTMIETAEITHLQPMYE